MMMSELFTIKFFEYRIVTFLPAQSLLLYVIKLKTTRIESVYDMKKVLCILRVLLKQTKMNLTVV